MRSWWSWWSMGGLAVAAAGLAGCTDVGSLTLKLQLPADEVLRPAGMTTVTVVTESPDEPTREVTGAIGFDENGVGSFDVGDLPLIDGVAVTVSLRSPADRLVGYGAATSTVDLTTGATLTLPIPVRRPLLYVGDAAGGALEAVDPTRDAGEANHQLSIADAGGAAQAIVSLDGARMAIVSDGQLRLIDTATNLPIGSPRAIPDDVRDAAAGPDGWVVIAHGDGVTAVNVDSGDSATLIVGRVVDRVSVGRRGEVATVFALSSQVLPPTEPDGTCGGISRAVAVPLSGGDAIDLITDMPLADIAANPAVDGGFAVNPCSNSIVRLADGSDLATVIRASHLVLSRTTLWAAGNAQPTIVDDNGTSEEFQDDVIIGGNIVLVSVSPDGSGRRQIDLPPQLQVVSNTDDPAHELSNILQGDSVRPIDLAVLPDDEAVALISELDASTTALTIGFDVIIPGMAVTVREIQLIDTASASVAQRVRLSCEPTIVDPANAEFANWECAAAAVGTAPTHGEFTPSALGVLYGAR